MTGKVSHLIGLISSMLRKLLQMARNVIDKIRRHFRQNLPQWVLGAIIVLFLVFYFWPRIVITINSGEAGVFYSRFFGGTKIDKVYTEGLHIIFPWNTMVVYNVRYQTLSRDMNVLTKRGLQLRVTYSVRYKPETEVLGVLHQRVGPDYWNKIVIPEVEATLRKVIGHYDVEEVYSSQHDIVQKLANETFSSVSEKFVTIDTLLITNIELPKKIRDAIETKLEQQQLAQAYEYKIDKEKLEAERKRIEAEGVRNYNTIVSSTLNENLLRWKGIDATLDISKSPNAKVIIVGSGKSGLPVILDAK
jgi:regulator of protease activity HflC (stomatin/prohibitin superfamily)